MPQHGPATAGIRRGALPGKHHADDPVARTPRALPVERIAHVPADSVDSAPPVGGNDLPPDPVKRDSIDVQRIPVFHPADVPAVEAYPTAAHALDVRPVLVPGPSDAVYGGILLSEQRVVPLSEFPDSEIGFISFLGQAVIDRPDPFPCRARRQKQRQADKPFFHFLSIHYEGSVIGCPVRMHLQRAPPQL